MHWCIVVIPRFSSVSHIKFWPVSPVPSKLKKEVFFLQKFKAINYKYHDG